MDDCMLRVTGLSKSFGVLRALDKVDISITKGRIHGIIGPNGSGKTTLFN
jgi:ABC-type branched-subunit amino acid transport system ATPase component